MSPTARGTDAPRRTLNPRHRKGNRGWRVQAGPAVSLAASVPAKVNRPRPARFEA